MLRDSIPHGLVPGERTWLTGARVRGVRPRCGEPTRATVGGRPSVFCNREQR